jgi:hypothetical protein
VIDWSTLEGWPLAEAIRHSVWAYPALETLHIAALATLVGSLLVLELRVFGAQPALSLTALGRLAVRTALTGFAFAVLSGSLLFLSDAGEIAAMRWCFMRGTRCDGTIPSRACRQDCRLRSGSA